MRRSSIYWGFIQHRSAISTIKYKRVATIVNNNSNWKANAAAEGANARECKLWCELRWCPKNGRRKPMLFAEGSETICFSSKRKCLYIEFIGLRLYCNSFVCHRAGTDTCILRRHTVRKFEWHFQWSMPDHNGFLRLFLWSVIKCVCFLANFSICENNSGHIYI